MSGYNKIPKVNDDNEVIGETTIAEAVENGWYRRISRVFLFDEKGRLLLQRRSSTMRSFPNLWDQSAAGHSDVGEDPATAARRELEEELGVSNLQLKEIVDAFPNANGHEKTFDSVYKGLVSSSVSLKLDNQEVSDIRWFAIDEFETALAANPADFVPPFVNVWKNFKDRLLQ